MPRHRSFLTALLMSVLVSYGHAQDEKVKAALGRLEGSVYGRGCGIIGADPAPRLQLESLLQLKDSIGVVEMLLDEDQVFQVYGAEGVIRLQRSGMQFPELIIQHVEKLRRSKDQIRVCSGCTHWIMPIHQALSDSMSVNNLR